ncbi:MAG: UvrD-helicase domain-containing protein [Caldilineaceae bacterium]|nr:UvrD-helicase domain-containing protein [Caldilineaceae bacterium]
MNKYVADLHIHSHYSRATSKDLNLEQLSRWAQLKGVQVVATGDIAHPGWLAELQAKLEPAEDGLFQLKPEITTAIQATVPPACQAPVRFLLGGEVSNIYKKNGAVRKIHHLIFMPTFAALTRLQGRLERIGNIRSDGRPILGLDSRDLLEIVLETDPQGYLIPAHIWTPWFAILGSKSGFDTVAECFDDLTPHIFALETGLSADPAMCWRISSLDGYTLISNSDAHSPPKLAREASLFATEFAYHALFDALKSGDPQQYLGTLEFFPEEGKYHLDGHRNCGICWHPQTSIAHQDRCTVCGKPVTVGVMHRVETLADRPEGSQAPNCHPYRNLIPLPEILGEVLGVGASSKRVQEQYHDLLTKLGAELSILLDAPLPALEQAGGTLLAEGIRRVRTGQVTIAGGYDGEYGVIKLFEASEKVALAAPQLGLFGGQTVTSPPLRPTAAATPSRPLATTMTAPPITAVETTPAGTTEPISTATELAEILAGLNDEQRTAATALDRNVIIAAGPGTGKTRTLTVRIAHLLGQGVAPEKILAITFTNKAAGEMRQRLRALLGPATARRLTIGTFHALGARILREAGEASGISATFAIASEEDRRALLKALLPGASDKLINQRLQEISNAKNALLLPDSPALATMSTRAEAETVEPAALTLPESYQRYQAALRANRLLDFDDLILQTVCLFEREPAILQRYQERFRWISVDEYQDINLAQYRLLRLLTPPTTNLCAIGDPDQAIYGFRGARREYFAQFPLDFPNAHQLRLERNYRSTQTILAAAMQVINESVDRDTALAIWSDFVDQTKLAIYQAPTDKAEAEYVVHQIEQMVGGTSYFSLDSGRVTENENTLRDFGDFAVLYRTSAQSRLLEEAFHRSGIPYQIVGQTPLVEHKEIRLLLAYLWLTLNPTATFYQEQIYVNARRKDLPRIGYFLTKLRDMQASQPVTALIAAVHTFLCEDLGYDLREAQQERIAQLSRRAAAFDHHLAAFLDALLLQKEEDPEQLHADRVTLMTLHAAKGLEFPVVFIVGCEETLLPYQQTGRTSDTEEERRLFYVGMTRAQAKLHLLHAHRRVLFGQRRQNPPSRFLQDIEATLKELKAMTSRKATKAEPEAAQLALFAL